MAETFSRYDAADYLKSPEDVAAYLDASAEDGDPAVMAAALGAVARAQNMSKLARDVGLTREGLYKALAPGGNPAFSTVAKVARALGFEVAFRPQGNVMADAPIDPTRKRGDAPAATKPTRAPRNMRKAG